MALDCLTIFLPSIWKLWSAQAISHFWHRPHQEPRFRNFGSILHSNCFVAFGKVSCHVFIVVLYFGTERLLFLWFWFTWDVNDVNDSVCLQEELQTGVPCDYSDWSPMLHVQRFTVHFVSQENVTIRAQGLLYRNAHLKRLHKKHRQTGDQTTWRMESPSPHLHSIQRLEDHMLHLSAAEKCTIKGTVTLFSKFAVSPL